MSEVKISSLSFGDNSFDIVPSGNFEFGENDYCFGVRKPEEKEDPFFKSLEDKEFKVEFEMSSKDGDWLLRTVFYDKLGWLGKIKYNICKLFRRIL